MWLNPYIGLPMDAITHVPHFSAMCVSHLFGPMNMNINMTR